MTSGTNREQGRRSPDIESAKSKYVGSSLIGGWDSLVPTFRNRQIEDLNINCLTNHLNK
jgi:hypothetical protein